MVPDDWKRALAAIATTFHFTEAELWSMTAERLAFWCERIEELHADATEAARARSRWR